jgi:hypothetical protein
MRPSPLILFGSLKFPRNMPITRMGMLPSASCIRVFALALLCWGWAPSEAGKRNPKAIPVVAPEPKKDQTLVTPPIPAPAEAGKPGSTFAELSFNRTLVIEGKVEKPQVTFSLLKEPPPEKEVRFQASFLENILKLDRENTFVPGETYGHE